jgi:hypothetical protein
MRLPRVRLTVRRMMLVIAVVAVLLSVPLHWDRYLRRVKLSPLKESRLTMLKRPDRHARYIPGEAIPIRIGYDLKFSRPGPPPGMFFLVQIEAKVLDMGTKKVVARRTWRRSLVAGLRDESSGTLDWEVWHTAPGRYRLTRELRYMDFLGRWRPLSGGAGAYQVLPQAPASNSKP